MTRTVFNAAVVMDPRFFLFSLVLFYLFVSGLWFLSCFILFFGNVSFGTRCRFLAEQFRRIDLEDEGKGDDKI